MEMPFSFALLLAKIRMLLAGSPDGSSTPSFDRPRTTLRNAWAQSRSF